MTLYFYWIVPTDLGSSWRGKGQIHIQTKFKGFLERERIGVQNWYRMAYYIWRTISLITLLLFFSNFFSI